MKDQRSATGNDVQEPYGPDYWAHFLDDLDEEELSGEGPHLISVDELRAAGALDVPAAWRKSLGAESAAERDLFSGLAEDDEPRAERGQAEAGDLE